MLNRSRHTDPMGKPATKGRKGTKRAVSPRPLAVDGNRLTFLPDGPKRLDALVALIDGARHSVRLLYYIFLSDASGERVKEALFRAIDRGVTVALLIDGFGSSATPDDYFVDLSRAGAKFCRFNPSFGRRYLLRNHQKLALADGDTDKGRAMIGGFNVADDYFGEVAAGAWRDVGLIVEGPAAARLAPYFDQLIAWAMSRKSKMRALRHLVRHFNESSGPLQWQFGVPSGRLSPWGVSTCKDLVQSRNVEMIAAYFAPTGGLIKRIARVGRHGRARVITAAKSDNNATPAAARFTYGRLLKRGVEIFEYVPTKLHTKLVVLDNVVHIGSSNFDIRSMYLNMELMLRVDNASFAKRMRAYFEGELGKSLAITPQLHKKRATLLNRIRWALSFFLVTSFDYGVTRRLNFNLTGA